MCLSYFVFNLMVCNIVSSLSVVKNVSGVNSESSVTDYNDVFPYMAAIMDKSRYLCAGALIDEKWVLTVAHSVYLFRGSLRFLRVHLGSANYKYGGELYPIKNIEVHPYFNDQKPEFDVALVQLGRKVMKTSSLNPIRLQMTPKKIMATHFIVTSWPMQPATSVNTNKVLSQDDVTKRRMLRVERLHPLNHDQCEGELEDMEIMETDIMCLDRGEELDPCSTDVGAPVVLNNILWGVVSSWVPEDCDLDPGPMLVTMVASPNISTWIYETLHGKPETKQELKIDKVVYEDE